MRINNCQIFMYDCTPCRRSKVVKKFLLQNSLQMLARPQNSPNLNLIENLGNIMKNKVSQKRPSSLDAHQTAIKELWVKKSLQITAPY